MATKPLENLVLPVLKAAPFPSELSDEGNSVTFMATLLWYTLPWQVTDHSKPRVLTIAALDIAAVAPDDSDTLRRVNACNDSCFGKFVVVNQTLRYSLELPYGDDTTAAVFQHSLFLALDTVAMHAEDWLTDAGVFQRIKNLVG